MGMPENPVIWGVYQQEVTEVAEVAVAEGIRKVASAGVSLIAEVAGFDYLIWQRYPVVLWRVSG